MKLKAFISVALTMLLLSVHAQSIEQREDSLSYYDPDGAMKGYALELLEIDPFNPVALEYLIMLYEERDQWDSITPFWEGLVAKNPNEPLVYLRRSQLRGYDNSDNKQEIQALTHARKLAPKNEEINFLLGKLYYETFIENNTTEHARLSIECFDNLCEMDMQQKFYLKTPLIQMANYLKDQKRLSHYRGFPDRSSHIPILAFADLNDGWETDFGYNVFEDLSGGINNIRGIEGARFTTELYSKDLRTFMEPALYDTLSYTVYRLTVLPAFSTPFVVRVETRDGKSRMYWKTSKSNRRFEDGKIRSKTKELHPNEMAEIEKSLEQVDFWNISTNEGLKGLDGSLWLLEGVKDGKYHVVERWSGGVIMPVGDELLGRMHE